MAVDLSVQLNTCIVSELNTCIERVVCITTLSYINNHSVINKYYKVAIKIILT